MSKDTYMSLAGTEGLFNNPDAKLMDQIDMAFYGSLAVGALVAKQLVPNRPIIRGILNTVAFLSGATAALAGYELSTLDAEQPNSL